MRGGLKASSSQRIYKEIQRNPGGFQSRNVRETAISKAHICICDGQVLLFWNIFAELANITHHTVCVALELTLSTIWEEQNERVASKELIVSLLKAAYRVIRKNGKLQNFWHWILGTASCGKQLWQKNLTYRLKLVWYDFISNKNQGHMEQYLSKPFSGYDGKEIKYEL